ncbi:hypothetical protein F5Y15DRAFT_385477 [Xylariaceae sp. FL0016]|nr:hypothetical protein F5Y15DRAFT_385477 [Xylariaceae sp. FL0016]
MKSFAILILTDRLAFAKPLALPDRSLHKEDPRCSDTRIGHPARDPASEPGRHSFSGKSGPLRTLPGLSYTMAALGATPDFCQLA